MTVKLHHIDYHIPKSQAAEEHPSNQHVDQTAKIEMAQRNLD